MDDLPDRQELAAIGRSVGPASPGSFTDEHFDPALAGWPSEEELRWAGPGLVVCGMSEDLRAELIRSKRGRVCWWLMRTYTTLASRCSRRGV